MRLHWHKTLKKKKSICSYTVRTILKRSVDNNSLILLVEGSSLQTVVLDYWQNCPRKIHCIRGFAVSYSTRCFRMLISSIKLPLDFTILEFQPYERSAQRFHGGRMIRNRVKGLRRRHSRVKTSSFAIMKNIHKHIRRFPVIVLTLAALDFSTHHKSWQPYSLGRVESTPIKTSRCFII